MNCEVKMRRYEQDKEREHFSQGAYLDVRDQEKAERDAVLRSIYAFTLNAELQAVQGGAKELTESK